MERHPPDITEMNLTSLEWEKQGTSTIDEKMTVEITFKRVAKTRHKAKDETYITFPRQRHKATLCNSPPERFTTS